MFKLKVVSAPVYYTKRRVIGQPYPKNIMYKRNSFYSISHSLDGYADTVEIDGKSYKADPENEGEPLKDDKGNPIPVDDPNAGGNGGGGNDNGGSDVDDSSLEELAKKNPAVAKALEEKREADRKLKEKEEQEQKAAEDKAKEQGEWQKLANEREEKAQKLEKAVEDSKNLIGKYKGTMKNALETVLKTIPEEKQKLIPKEFSERQKFEYIMENAEALGAKVFPNSGDGGAPPSDNTTLSEIQKLEKEVEELQSKKDKTQAEHDLLFEKAKKLKEKRKES